MKHFFDELQPLLILWSTPRSASTALEKAVMQHPNIKTLHEPFTDCYYFSTERRSARYGDSVERAKIDRSTVYATINAYREKNPLFIKELAFQALPYVTDPFLEEAQHLFLINNPDATYVSLIKLKPDFTDDEFGFTSLFSLYKRICRIKGKTLIIFTTREFRSNPKKILRQVCTVANISFSDAMLCWQPGAVRPWSPQEQDSQAKWHDKIERSTGIIPYQEPERRVDIAKIAQPTVATAWKIFEELTQPK